MGYETMSCRLHRLMPIVNVGWQMKWSVMQQSPVQPWQSSLCGAFAGGFSAAVTTPLDVAKTRIMLAPVGMPPAFM